MTTLDILIAVVAVGVGAFVQGSVGFGMNLIAAPVLLLVDERFVPGPAIAASTVLVILVAVRDRRGLHLGEVATAMWGRVPATILAGITIAVLPARPMAIVFAVLVLVSVGIVASGVRLEISNRNLVIAGALAGYMGTATAIGGPPMAMLYADEQGTRLRGTMSGFFLAGSVITIAVLMAAGELGSDDAGRIAVLVPSTVLGFAASGVGSRYLDRGRTRPAVLAVSGLAAVSVLVRSML